MVAEYHLNIQYFITFSIHLKLLLIKVTYFLCINENLIFKNLTTLNLRSI